MGFWNHDPSGTTLEKYYKELRNDDTGALDYPQSFVDIITPNAGGLKMAEGVYKALCSKGDSINWRLFPVSQGDFGAHDFWVKTAQLDERVFPILNDWNKPVPHAYNQAYMYSMKFKNPSPFIFTMDDDTRLIRDDWLQYLLWLRNSYPDPEQIGITTYGTSAIGRKPPEGKFWLENDVGWDSNLIYRPIFDRVGLADENYCWHFGDSDICRRLTLHQNYKILLGKQVNKWRSHFGRVGSSQLGYKEAWWRGMSIEVGGQKWANTPVKGVGAELGVDKVRQESYTYPKEGWWDAGLDFMTFDHGMKCESHSKFPFFIDDHPEVSCTTPSTDVNLRVYKRYREKHPDHKGMYDDVVRRLYSIEGTVDEFLQGVPEGL